MSHIDLIIFPKWFFLTSQPFEPVYCWIVWTFNVCLCDFNYTVITCTFVRVFCWSGFLWSWVLLCWRGFLLQGGVCIWGGVTQDGACATSCSIQLSGQGPERVCSVALPDTSSRTLHTRVTWPVNFSPRPQVAQVRSWVSSLCTFNFFRLYFSCWQKKDKLNKQGGGGGEPWGRSATSGEREWKRKLRNEGGCFMLLTAGGEADCWEASSLVTWLLIFFLVFAFQTVSPAFQQILIACFPNVSCGLFSKG